MERETCCGCIHHLGGEMCRLNVEAECGKGDRELYEPKETEVRWNEGFQEMG